jgi:Tfp pilus assembly protein PilN
MAFMKLLSCFVFLLIGLHLVQPAYSQDTTNSVAELQQQVQKLKAENESLKQENQVLRKLVFEKQNQPQTTAQPQTTTPVVPRASYQQPTSGASTAQQGYWMTTSSGKRHNSSCRYYGTTKGRPCSKDEGIPCKICGG